MVDIETLGTAPGSVVLSIGAVAFCPFAGRILGEFSATIDPASAVACGLEMDPTTVAWWMRQTEAARRAGFAEDALQLPDALARFTGWLAEGAPGRRYIWGHGATFDPVLLETAYRAAGHAVPWGHRDARDTRTLFDLAHITSLDDYRYPGDEAHVAASDARVQARAVIEAYARLQVGPPAGPAWLGEGTEWFWRIVDGSGLGNVPSDEATALRLLCTKASRYDESVGHNVPAPPLDLVQHVKTGGVYDVLHREARVQTDTPLTDYAKVSVYQGWDGKVWVRPVVEMEDGRFAPFFKSEA